MRAQRRILAFAKYGDAAASTRQRLLQYRPALEAEGFALDVRPLLDNDYLAALAVGRPADRVAVASAYATRLGTLLRRTEADLIWIAYELFPFLPGVAERLAFASGRPVVVDYDDATFHQYGNSPRPLVRRLLSGKLEPLLRGAAAVTAGNAYLAAYAGRFNDTLLDLPTVVDTDVYHPGDAPSDVPVIGWIGSPSTWRYVRPVLPLLAERCRAGRARFLVVGAGPAALADRFDGMECRDWAEAREVADIQEMDLGIMPLPDEPWARGKCGYKLIQYMACAIPAIGSPVGVNAEIVGDGQTGFLAAGDEAWGRALDALLASPELRARMGAAGRERAVEHYSLAAHAPRLVALFERLVR